MSCDTLVTREGTAGGQAGLELEQGAPRNRIAPVRRNFRGWAKHKVTRPE